MEQGLFIRGTRLAIHIQENKHTSISAPVEADFYCPGCHDRLNYNDNNLACQRCQVEYSLQEGIPVFAKKRGYWCTISKEKMHQLISDAKASQDWLAAVEKHIPRYAPHVVPLYRADAQFAFPIDANARVLDAGSMWGGLTIPIAQYVKEVVAIDQTWETLQFLKVRAKQMGLNNIKPIESSIHRLPFPDNYFDFVILNGVLEWLGVEQDIILEDHWDKKRKDDFQYKRSPRDMQLAALKELYRVTKPGGGIYVAIENRLGLQYFLGHPDDHVNVRFVTFMPRVFANYVTKKFRNTDYRTYIYSPNKLKALVTESGFKPQMLYTVYPHYGKISRMVPMSCFKHCQRFAKQGYAHIKIFILTLAWNLIPEPFAKHMAPSIALIAAKDKFTHPQRLLALLVQKQIIKKEAIDDYTLILANNRFANGHSTNYVVFNQRTKQSVFFCKIARQKELTALCHESEQLFEVNNQLQGSAFETSIPKLVCFDTIDGIHLQVTTFVYIKPISPVFSNGLRLLPRVRRLFTSRLMSPFAHYAQQLGRSRWLKQIDSNMMQAIDWLVGFQHKTETMSLPMTSVLETWLPEKIQAIENNGLSTEAIKTVLADKATKLQQYEQLTLPLVAQHGDYDICNVFKQNKQIFIVDFEHSSASQLPGFDLANLIFSPLLYEWKISNKNQSLQAYADETGWVSYLNKWIAHYASLTNNSVAFVCCQLWLAVIEQNAKQYPNNRDPYDYPMYGQESLDALMSFELCDIY